MARFRLSTLIVSLVLLLTITVGLVHAQRPLPGTRSQATPLGNTFTYQGYLQQDGKPFNGTVRLRFSLWDQEKDGKQVGLIVEALTVQVSDGLFTVNLNLGDVFHGEQRWLEVAVYNPATHGYTVLEPRQPLTAVPYAIYSRYAPWSGLQGVPPGLADGDDDTLGDLSATAGQVPQWNGSAWVAAAPSSGSGLTPGLGLRVSEDQFDVDFAGSGSENTVARSDHAHTGIYALTGHDHAGVYALSSHTHDGSDINGAVSKAHTADAVPWSGVSDVPEDLADGDSDTLGSLTAEEGQVPQWNGSAWVAAALSGGGGTGDHFGESWSGENAGAGLSITNSAGNGLYVESGSADASAVYAYNGAGGPALYMRSTSGNIMEAYGSDPERCIFYFENDGDFLLKGRIYESSADFAEMLPAEEGLEPGDVLAISEDGTLVRSTAAYQSSVAGVYSTEPGFVGGAGPGDDLTGKVPLAIMGVVPVKASAENGAIRPGDLLVASSIPGHAMRAGGNPPLGTAIGKALAGLSEDTGIIRMLVTLH